MNNIFKNTREQFYLPQDIVYLDGNSLGPLTIASQERIKKATIDEWGNLLIKGWNQAGWMEKPIKVGNQIAKLLKAKKNSIIVGDTLSIKEFQVISAAFQVAKKPGCILSDTGNFPSDLYIADQYLKDKNYPPLKLVSPEKIQDSILNDEISILMLTEVDYKTGRIHDMQALTKLAHSKGIITIWDLAHSAGAIEIDLEKTNVDFAIGCTYKYLCGGPGSPAFLYAREDHVKKIDPLIAGWLGHESPFSFNRDYIPAKDINKFRIGTPPVLQVASLEAALEVWDDISISEVRQKAKELTKLFCDEVFKSCKSFRLISPSDPEKRGKHVSFSTEHAYEKMQALIQLGVIGDFRGPNIVRFGFNPLFNSEEDVRLAVDCLYKVTKDKLWARQEYNCRNFVT